MNKKQLEEKNKLIIKTLITSRKVNMKQIQKLREEFNNKLDKLEAKLVKKKWTKIGNLEWSEPLGEMNWHDAKKEM